MKPSARWRALVRARLGEMERLAPGRGAGGAAYWNQPGRARRFHGALGPGTERDPLYSRLRRAVRSDSVVVDVGAGTGRFSLALAPRVSEVVAVDPSRVMLGVLAREARRQGIRNVRCIESRWQDATLSTDGSATGGGLVPQGDVVICSYVLPLIEDAAPFLAKMDAACRGRAFLYLNAFSGDALSDAFWRHFHGRPRRPSPTYLDAVEVLRELGARPEVEVVEIPALARYKNLNDAVRWYRDALLLPDTAATKAELRKLLGPWLVPDRGLLRAPVRTMPAAIVSWPGSGGRRRGTSRGGA